MNIVIAGAGEIGSHLARMLRAEDNVVTVVDDDQQRISGLSAGTDVEAVLGSPTSLNALRRAGASQADLFVAVYPFTTQEMNLVSAMMAKQLGAAKVVARVNEEEYLTSENKLVFKEMGIELLFYPEKSAADEIVASLRHKSSSEMMEFARGKLQISMFRITEDSKILDLKLREFIASVPEEDRKQFRVIAISRDRETIIPKLDSKFLYGDTIFTISRQEGLEILCKYFGKSNPSANNVMIMGGTAIASMVAKKLEKQGTEVSIIDKDREKCLELTEALPEGVKIINADGRNSDVLYDEGIKDCDAFIAVTSHDENNILACVAAKKFGVPRTIAEVENMEYIRLAEELGIDTIINKKQITAGKIFKFTLSGRARFVRYMNGTDAEVLEYTVPRGAAITKGALKDVEFPQDAIICGIIRGNDSFIAVGETVIEAYDRVAIFAMPESIKKIDRFFE